MKLFLGSLVFLFLFVECIPFPRCCYQPYNFINFLFTFRRGIPPCNSDGKAIGNICFSCKVPIKSQDSMNSSKVLKISEPQVLCVDVDARNETDSGRLVLSWSWSEAVTSSFIFMIEARHHFMQIEEWGTVGVTNVTFAEITNLDLRLEYQFRVTPVIMACSTLQPMTSNWTKLLDIMLPVSPPTNVSVSGFQVKNGLIDATVKWSASEESPCSYELLWLRATGNDYFQQKTIILPHDDLSVILPELMFETKYTIIITPNGVSRKVTSAKVLFTTPTCLNLTGGNFSICAPASPQNVSVYWNNDNEAIIKWMPPIFTSAENPVSGYHISAVESINSFQSPEQYVTHKIVEKDYLNVTFQRLKRTRIFAFEVRAVSEGGIGNPAIVELEKPAISTSIYTYSLPYLYIIFGVGVPLVITVLTVITTLSCKRMCQKRKEGSSGIVDDIDYMRPYLIPVDKVELQEVIGKGAFGIVHRGILTRSKSKEEVAVKVFPSETMTRRQLLQEVELMNMVGKHDQIVGFQGFSLDVEKMFLVLEYCPWGDLHSYLLKLKPRLIEIYNLPPAEMKFESVSGGYGRQLCSYIYQVAQGMEYIAGLKFIHRDLAARNILMLNKHKVKIGDFGLSKDVYETKVYNGSFQRKLPIKWMAPEAIEKQKFTTYSDVWSFGIFMWEVLKVGNEPYTNMTNSEVLDFLKMGYRLERPHCTKEWYELMCRCWRENPKQRPPFKELVIRVRALLNKIKHHVYF